MHFYPLPQLSRKRIHDIQPIKRERNSTLKHLFLFPRFSSKSSPRQHLARVEKIRFVSKILSQKLIRNSLKILKYRNISFFDLFYKLTFRIISYIYISHSYIILHNDRCFFNQDFARISKILLLIQYISYS